MKPTPLAILAFVTFGLSVISFLVMRNYQSQVAGWAAVIFGFIAISSMVISGLRKLKVDKAPKSKS